MGTPSRETMPADAFPRFLEGTAAPDHRLLCHVLKCLPPRGSVRSAKQLRLKSLLLVSIRADMAGHLADGRTPGQRTGRYVLQAVNIRFSQPPPIRPEHRLPRRLVHAALAIGLTCSKDNARLYDSATSMRPTFLCSWRGHGSICVQRG